MCSVSQSQVPVVARYVQNQKEHHRKIDSADEFALLLKRHGLVVRENLCGIVACGRRPGTPVPGY